MHSTALPQSVVTRVLDRRGHLHPFDSLDPSRTALIVVDMQNAFCQAGQILEVPVAREIVDNINTLAAATRRTDGQVVWVQMTIPTMASWPVFLGSIVPSEAAKAKVLASLQPGSDGHKLWPSLHVESGDWIVEKNRFSAFLSSACDLMERLGRSNIDTVVIVGTLTNVCCESSARDAAMQDFKVVLVSDANACHTDEAHIATLSTIIQSFGDVRSTLEVVDMLSVTRPHPSAPA
jgi:ureidoacrylate peracid hydrolase